MSDDQRACAGSEPRQAVDDVAVEFDASLASLLRRTDGSGVVVDGPLPARLREARAAVAAAVGFALRPVQLRVVADLREHTYRVLVRGAKAVH
jgi:hypothetical protein